MAVGRKDDLAWKHIANLLDRGGSTWKRGGNAYIPRRRKKGCSSYIRSVKIIYSETMKPRTRTRNRLKVLE